MLGFDTHRAGANLLRISLQRVPATVPEAKTLRDQSKLRVA